MGALPKRKISVQRKNNRRSHQALAKLNTVTCPTCKRQKLPHTVCKYCGKYKV